MHFSLSRPDDHSLWMRVRESEVCGWEMARFSGHPLKPGIGEMLSINGTGVLLRKADSRFYWQQISGAPHLDRFLQDVGYHSTQL
jgi:hypothetical protein